LKSTGFYIRFGKLKVWRSEKIAVSIVVNGEEIKTRMVLGKEGEAFFELLKPRKDRGSQDETSNCKQLLSMPLTPYIVLSPSEDDEQQFISKAPSARVQGTAELG